MARRLAAAAAGLVAAVTLLGLVHAEPAGAAPSWRLEQPPPPPPAPFTVPLGAPGDLECWAANRCLVSIEGNSTVARGLYVWNGQAWRQYATVCGGPGDTARIAWAGPTEFWVVSVPSLPRGGAGLSLCRFKDGQVVGSWSTAPEAPDPFRRMLSATCNGPNDCWFGGIGSQDALGERIGAFHLHWDGADLESVYGPQGRGVSDMSFHDGELFESTLVGRSPENRADPVELAEPEAVPRLLHRVDGGAFANDPFEPAPQPGVPVDGTELLGLDSDGTDLWAVGGGAASGPSAPANGSVPRQPLVARLTGSAVTELSLTGATFSDTTRFADVAAIPGTGSAFATAVPFGERQSSNSKATVAMIAPDGSATTTRLPAAGSGRGSAARIDCPAPTECWMVTWAGWLFHWTDGTPLPVDTDPAFQGTITFRPNEAAEQFIPDTPPEDDSQLFAPPEDVEEPEPPVDEGGQGGRKLLKNVDSKLQGRNLIVSFTVVRKCKVQLVAKRKGKVVGKTPRKKFTPGNRRLVLRVDPDRYPTKLEFKVKEVK